MVQVYYLSAARDLLPLGVDWNAVDGVLEEHVAAVLEYGAGGVVQLVSVRRRFEYLHRPPRLCHTCIRVVMDSSVADPGYLSRIPDPDFYSSRIPDPKTVPN